MNCDIDTVKRKADNYSYDTMISCFVNATRSGNTEVMQYLKDKFKFNKVTETVVSGVIRYSLKNSTYSNNINTNNESIQKGLRFLIDNDMLGNENQYYNIIRFLISNSMYELLRKIFLKLDDIGYDKMLNKEHINKIINALLITFDNISSINHTFASIYLCKIFKNSNNIIKNYLLHAVRVIVKRNKMLFEYNYKDVDCILKNVFYRYKLNLIVGDNDSSIDKVNKKIILRNIFLNDNYYVLEYLFKNDEFVEYLLSNEFLNILSIYTTTDDLVVDILSNTKSKLVVNKIIKLYDINKIISRLNFTNMKQSIAEEFAKYLDVNISDLKIIQNLLL